MSAPVLVFDSGVGGLTIAEAVRAAMPGMPRVYGCDNAAFPYGPKPDDALVERVHTVLDALIARYNPRMLIVACNTASTIALPRLRSHHTLPIIGVVPAIKPAAQISHNRILGLLATPGTVRRTYTDQLIRDFAPDCRVIRVGSSELVLEAERALRGAEPDAALLRKLLAPIVEGGADTVVLGCTHFPLLRDELARAAGVSLNWVDSGEAIAQRVVHLLRDAAPAARVGAQPDVAVFTRDGDDVAALRPALAARGFTDVRLLAV